jgi:hypothetical protein
MRTIVGLAVLAVALGSSQTSAQAATIGLTTEVAQPLTRAVCEKVGIRRDENGNVCDSQPGENKQITFSSASQPSRSSDPWTRSKALD